MLISIAFTDEELKTILIALVAGSIHSESEIMANNMIKLAKKFEMVGLLRKEG